MTDLKRPIHKRIEQIKEESRITSTDNDNNIIIDLNSTYHDILNRDMFIDVLKTLRQIEITKKIHILYAVETGLSKGLNDLDVKFVFINDRANTEPKQNINISQSTLVCFEGYDFDGAIGMVE